MAIKFRSLCSGSGGNSAVLWTDMSAVLIDFAPGCQRDCRETLSKVRTICGRPSAVLVTHAHGDHINANSLKILKQEDIKARSGPEVCRHIRQLYGEAYAGTVSSLENGTMIGDIEVRHIRVPHAPGYHTTAFSFTTKERGRKYKAAVFTDLNAFTDAHVAFAMNSDLLFLEANHDAGLVKLHGHPGSEFHLPNHKAAQFLHEICRAGSAQPRAVVLGHLSDSCNRPDLPPGEITGYFRRKGLPVEFEIHVAKPHEPGQVIAVS